MPLNETELAEYRERDRQYRELTDYAPRHICAVCNGPLVVRWWQGKYEIICGNDKSHEIGHKGWHDHPAQVERRARENANKRIER